MAQKQHPQGARDPAPPTVTAPGGQSPLEAFSNALAQRYPGRVIQRFAMPSTVRECREVFILEISSNEEIQAAIFTDTIMSPIERSSAKLTAECERRESIRLAIVGLGELVNGAIAYRHTNIDGAPLGEISSWSSKSWAALHRYFGEVNGVPISEINEGIQGAQIVGAFYAPKTETPPSAGTGRSGGSSGTST